ncbi:MAG TPA: hypothetical protein VNN80_36435 [Polyangiaceae bacterium]|nr:hypothetical protein [Polyangiaceae bacterium]
MGSCCHHRLGRPARAAQHLSIGALVFAFGSALLRPALAQGHPDAGAPRHATGSAGAAGELRQAPLKSLHPALLSEGVRARLAERAAGRHPSEIAAPTPAPTTAPTPVPSPPSSLRTPIGGEPLRRGVAHLRRVQALDTGDGVTVLSNRLRELPPPRLAAVAATPAEPEADPSRLAQPPEELAEHGSRVTETRSLRAMSSRREVPKAREQGLGVDWLLWPFVLLLATGAVVGTLWFSKKTQ